MESVTRVLLHEVYLLSILSSTGPLLLVLLLLLMSATISSSEVALFSLSPQQKADLRESKNSSDAHIMDLLEKPDREQGPKKLLATILIANNALNIAIVLLATQITNSWFATEQYEQWVKTLIELVAITFVLVLFGEVIPKVYATGNNLRVSRLMALPLKFIMSLCAPLTWMLTRSTKVLETKVRHRAKGNISVDELGHALELTQDDERSMEEHKILEGIVTFGNKEVSQIMTPRTDIAALWLQDSFIEVLEKVKDKGYSRLPVFNTSQDEIAGFLFIKDLLPYLDIAEFRWQEILKPPFYVAENKRLDDLLEEFQKEKRHMAIVVDEYGGTSGLVTLEDILEEIVGDIRDEFDEEEQQYSVLDEHNYVFEAKISLVDMYKILDIDESLFEQAKGDSTTLGGFVIEQAGHIPERGDVIEFENFQFSIESADKRKIKRVKVTMPQAMTNT
ncbi:MAG: gliding motility-associated protein GldE [Flavobacteriales bacterium]